MANKLALFDGDSEDEAAQESFKINKDYAERYEEWREAEIKRKLEDRYGNEELSIDSSSEDEPENLENVMSKDFFEVISALKTKNPSIYNPEVKFFKNEEAEAKSSKQKNKKEKVKPLFLRDYERKLVTERRGKLSDDESDEEQKERKLRSASPTYVEEQRQLKEALKNAVQGSDDESDGFLKKKEKTTEEKEKEDKDYLAWLRGEKSEIKDKDTEECLKPLHSLWNDPNLNENEKFLRDYILKKQYLQKDDEPIDEGNLTDEDYHDEYMNEFERKYNFRFEEPDKEFLKRYPRTTEQSVRKKDTRRKEKREAVKLRKEEEKKKRKEELKVLKALKRKEILKKIEKIKEITGNDQLGIDENELEEDFDPEAHDRRMKELFNDEYYDGGEDEEELDELNLPPLESDLVDDNENWDEWDGTDQCEEGDVSAPHCDDPEFNMDCDYDPATSSLRVEEQVAGKRSAKERRKLKRQSRFGRLVRKKKPVFDPEDKTFEQYVDEYYGMDYEDLIGDVQCRFKYRKVVPNSFGLTIEEILAADDKELNQWASIKKTYTLRPDHVERYDVKAYERKAQDEALKRKILPSLFKHETNSIQEEKPKQKKKIKEKESTPAEDQPQETNPSKSASAKSSKKKKKRDSNNESESQETKVSDDGNKKEEVLSKIIKKDKKKRNKQKNVEILQKEFSDNIIDQKPKVNKININKSVKKTGKNFHSDGQKKSEGFQVRGKKRKLNDGKRRADGEGEPKWKKRKDNTDNGISDARLKAYGIRPKKYRNKLKYGSSKS